jgi:hypothetical protein
MFLTNRFFDVIPAWIRKRDLLHTVTLTDIIFQPLKPVKIHHLVEDKIVYMNFSYEALLTKMEIIMGS